MFRDKVLFTLLLDTPRCTRDKVDRLDSNEQSLLAQRSNEIRRIFYKNIPFPFPPLWKHERDNDKSRKDWCMHKHTRRGYYSFLFPVRRLSNLRFHDNGVEVRAVVLDTRNCGPRTRPLFTGVGCRCCFLAEPGTIFASVAASFFSVLFFPANMKHRNLLPRFHITHAVFIGTVCIPCDSIHTRYLLARLFSPPLSLSYCEPTAWNFNIRLFIPSQRTGASVPRRHTFSLIYRIFFLLWFSLLLFLLFFFLSILPSLIENSY